jgi:hypothetical protein
LRMFALQGGEQFPFHPPLKVRAGLRSRHIKLGRDGKGMTHGRQDDQRADVSKA